MDGQLHLTPWRELGVRAKDVNPVSSMISADESLYLYWLARCRYSGRGEIIDGGPLLGGSTIALAEGLRLNDAVQDKRGRIHSYDLFEYTPFMPTLFRNKRWKPKFGSSLLPRFKKNIRPWASSVAVYPGDVLDYSWPGAPIEILFIDFAKSWEVQRHILREFFPHLIPGVSVVVQQDYFFVSTYWIHLVMEALSEYFRPVHMPEGPTLGFEAVAPAPKELLDFDYERELSTQEAVALMDRSLARFDGAKRLVAMTSKVQLLLAHGEVQAARDVLENIRSATDFGDTVRIDFDKAEQRVARAERKKAATA